MKVSADGFEFDFTNARDVFVFDEKNSSHHRFHGMSMKAVDLIVELDESWLFIEMKDLEKAGDVYSSESVEDDMLSTSTSPLARLKTMLKYKFRDTYLFRYAEGKIDHRPVHYLCLLTMDNPECAHLKKLLSIELPTITNNHSLWDKALAQSCQVLNITAWNKNFPQWPVQRTAMQTNN